MRALRFKFTVLCAIAMACTAAQTPYPPAYIRNVVWNADPHYITVPQPIISPGYELEPTTITGTTHTEFISATEVRLTPGFHAGGFSGEGRFRAWIDEGLGDPSDVIVIAPENAVSEADNMVHVPKWEKLEVGLKLPEEYEDAIAGFFDHYYSNGQAQASTPGQVDAVHDLNPYSDDSLQVWVTLTAPNGQQRLKWGFYMKEAKWASSSPTARLTEDLADTLHPYPIRFRMAPDMEGVWQLSLSLRAPLTLSGSDQPLPTLTYTGLGFVCDPPLDDNHGYLNVNEANRRTLQFDDGTSFFGLGTNLGANRRQVPIGAPSSWLDTTVYYLQKRDFDTMQNAMEELASMGGNFLRMYLMRQNFAPEWVNLGVYDAYRSVLSCDSTSQFPTLRGNCQFDCWAFDQMVDLARAENQYIQLCIDPYPPIIAYQSHQWISHPYYLHFLKPNRRPAPDNPYDLKSFFFTTDSTGGRLYDSGVFYYWKRRYKYIMARWGYSVNIAAIEPFNEIDQLLSYRDVLVEENCPVDNGLWLADPEIPHTLDQWITDISTFTRGTQQPNDPVHSPLGESNRMFLLSYARSEPSDTAFYLPFKNPNVDLLDVHTGLEHEWDVRHGFDVSQAYRDNYTSSGIKKPFHQGEYTTYGHKDIIMGLDTTDYETYPFFANYGISFHNELWASAFSGNFAAGTSWAWERVFWFPGSLFPPIADAANLFQGQRSNILGGVNRMDLGWGYGIPVSNRRIHHHFKPLAELLNHPNWIAYGFFDGPISAYRHTSGDNSDESRKVECYYLVNADSTVAIGWVHNMNAYWQNSWYMTAQNQNMLGCTSPSTQSIALTGFADGTYYVTYVPTWVNDTVCPANDTLTVQEGALVLDLSSEPLNNQAGALLDTLHADYAFVIASVPFVKRRSLAQVADPVPHAIGWDFGLFPNPAQEEVVLQFADDLPRDVVLHDLTGRQLRQWRNVRGPLQPIAMPTLATGSYWVRVSDGVSSRTKKLIVQ